MFPRQVSDPTPQSYPDGHLGEGFAAACLPFALGSTVTMAASALDLLSDWLAYRTFKNIDLPWRVEQLSRNNETKDALWGWDNLYKRLPDIFFYFMILATVVFLTEVVRFSYMFNSQRKQFKEKRDGLPYKKSFVEKCGGELVIVLHVFFEDLPVSLILLAVQVAISCQMFLPFQNQIYLLCIGSTCFSLCWKVLQVVWNAGCLGQREEYHRGCAIFALRCATLVLLASTLCISTLNLLIFPAVSNNFKGHSLSNSLLDKIGIYHWTRNDYIVFAQGESRPDYNGTSGRDVQLDTDSSYYVDRNLARIEDVVYNEGNYTQVSIPCDNATLFDFIQPAHKQLKDKDCRAVFAFLYDSFQETIFYNYGYTAPEIDDRCSVGTFRDDMPLADADLTQEWKASRTSDSVSPTASVAEDLTSLDGRNISHTISMSSTTSKRWVKCSFHLVLNQSIPLNLCP